MFPLRGRSRGLLTLACLLLCGSLAVALPFHLLRGSRYGYARNIRPSACYMGKEKGVCMFAWDCMETSGTHLGTCMDRFYFGSCCKMQDTPVVVEIPDEVTNQVTNEVKPLTPSHGSDEKEEDEMTTQGGEAEDDSSESDAHGEGAVLGGGGAAAGEVDVTPGSVGQEEIQSDGSDDGDLDPESVPPEGQAGGEAAGGEEAVSGQTETSGEKESEQADEATAAGEAVSGQAETSGEKESGQADDEAAAGGEVSGETETNGEKESGQADDGAAAGETVSGQTETSGEKESGQADDEAAEGEEVSGETEASGEKESGQADGEAAAGGETVSGQTETSGEKESGQADGEAAAGGETVSGQTETSGEKESGHADDEAAAGGEAVSGETETSGEKESGEKVPNEETVTSGETGSSDETTETPELFPMGTLSPTPVFPGQGATQDQQTEGADDGEESAVGTEESMAVDPSPSTSSPLPTTIPAEQDGGSAEEDSAGTTEAVATTPTEGASGITEETTGVTEDDVAGVTEGITVEITEQDTDGVTEGITEGDEEAGTTETPGTQAPSSGEEDTTGGPTEVPKPLEDTEDDSTTSTPADIYSPAPVGAPGTEQPDQDTTDSPLPQTTLREEEDSEEATEEITTTLRTPGEDLTTIVSHEPSATTLSPASGEVETTIPSVHTQETTLQSVPPSTIIPSGSTSEEDTSSSETSPSATPQEATTTEPTTTKSAPIVFPGPSAADVTTEQPEETERPPLLTSLRPLVVRPITKPPSTTTSSAQDSSEEEVTKKPVSSEESEEEPGPDKGAGESSTTEKTPTTTEKVKDELLENLRNSTRKQICGKPVYPTKRIVGGSEATYGEWPWQVSLRQWRHVTFLHKCGAALVNRNWAITAAHCVENVQPEQLLVRLGEFDLETSDEPYPFVERKVQIVASHPKFEPRTFEYDLALLRFDEPIDYQPNIIPICIPEDDYNFLDDTGYVTGWGRLYEDGPLPSVMQKVPVPVITNKECEEMYRKAGFVEDIPNIFICAGYGEGGRDSCEGDSGGPLVIQRKGRWRLAGVISWGIGCALPNQPGVYTRISEFREWVEKIIVF